MGADGKLETPLVVPLTAVVLSLTVPLTVPFPLPLPLPLSLLGIKDVLEQVSSLFADHPDLLREFTYFLPDPVQEQARERLNRAAR